MILSKMRTGVFSGLFLGVLVLGGVGLILSDGAGTFRDGVGGGTNVVEIDGNPIKSIEFDRIVRGSLQGQSLSVADAYKAGYIDRILQNEVMSRLLRKAAYDFGIIASNQVVATELKKALIPVTGPEGDTKAALDRVLQAQGLSEKALVESMRNDISTNLLRETIGGGVYVPNAMSKAFYEWNLEERTINYVSLPASSVNIDAPTTDQLAKFYEGLKPQYTIAETRNLTVAIVDPASLISAKDAKDESGDAVFEVTNQIEDRLAAGENPENLAEEFKMKIIKLEKVDASTGNAAGLEDYSADRARILQTAFTTNVNESSPLSEMASGKMFTVHVNAITEARAKDLKDIKADVTEKWTALEKRRKLLVKALELTQTLDEKKTTLDKIAKEYGTGVKNAKLVRGSAAPEGFNSQSVAQIMSSDIKKAIAIPDISSIQIVKVEKVSLPDKTATGSEIANIEKNLALDLQEERFVSFINHIERASKVKVNKDLIDRMYGQPSTEQ